MPSTTTASPERDEEGDDTGGDGPSLRTSVRRLTAKLQVGVGEGLFQLGDLAFVAGIRP